MQFDTWHTDEQLLAELGRRLARCRLDMDATQAALAFEAGISKRTLERIEAGASVQTTSLIRVLRALRPRRELGRPGVATRGAGRGNDTRQATPARPLDKTSRHYRARRTMTTAAIVLLLTAPMTNTRI